MQKNRGCTCLFIFLAVFFGLPLIGGIFGAIVSSISPSGGGNAPGLISDFHSTITVNRDASLTVHETVTYQHQVADPFTGLVRFVPTEIHPRWGLRRLTPGSILSATCNSTAEMTSLRPLRDGMLIEFGSPGSDKRNGIFTYDYTYRVERVFDTLPGGDRCVWHATGADWDMPIAHASVTVMPPDDVPASELRVQGLLGKSLPLTSALDATGKGQAVDSGRALQRKEGLTVQIDLPPGTVTQPAPEAARALLWQDNGTLFFGSIALGMVLLIYLAMQLLVGRDPKRGIIVSRGTPPEGVSPTMAHFLTNSRYEPLALAATMVQLAVRGLCRFEERKDRYVLHLNDDFPSARKAIDALARDPATRLSVEEMQVATIVFNHRKTFEFNDDHADDFRKMAKAVEGTMEAHTEQVLMHHNRGMLWLGISFGTLLLCALAFIDVPAAFMGERIKLIFGLITLSVGGALLPYVAYNLWKDIFSFKVGRIGNWGLIIMYLLIGVAFVLLARWLMSPASSLLWMFTLAITALHVLFNHLLKAPTLNGRKVLDALEGFKRYLEGHPVHTGSTPVRTPGLFAQYLPYALALGVQEAWAKQFTPDFAGKKHGETMEWFYGPSWDGEDVEYLANSLANELAPSCTPVTIPMTAVLGEE
jgi:hypothetical protein